MYLCFDVMGEVGRVEVGICYEITEVCVYIVCCVLCRVHVMLLCDNNQKCCVLTCCPAFGSHLVLLYALMCSVVTMVK